MEGSVRRQVRSLVFAQHVIDDQRYPSSFFRICFELCLLGNPLNFCTLLCNANELPSIKTFERNFAESNLNL